MSAGLGPPHFVIGGILAGVLVALGALVPRPEAARSEPSTTDRPSEALGIWLKENVEAVVVVSVGGCCNHTDPLKGTERLTHKRWFSPAYPMLQPHRPVEGAPVAQPQRGFVASARCFSGGRGGKTQLPRR